MPSGERVHHFDQPSRSGKANHFYNLGTLLSVRIANLLNQCFTGDGKEPIKPLTTHLYLLTSSYPIVKELCPL
jgi:hypothetical protein